MLAEEFLADHQRKKCFGAFFSTLLGTFLLEAVSLSAHFCGENKVPYGLEVYRNGQPQLLCSRPNCFDKIYSDCDERAMRDSCHSNTTWVGGFEKSYGLTQPLYLQEEVMDKDDSDEMVAFDLISNMRKIGGRNSTDPVAFAVDVRRVRCNDVPQQKRYKPWHWP